MKIDLRNVAAAASIALLAACGGSSGNAALSKTFTYGAAQSPSSSEQSAASTAQVDLSNTAGFNSSPDPTKGAAFFSFATDLGNLAFSGSGVPAFPRDADISHALTSAQFNSACTTVSGNTVTFSNCSQSESGYNFTFNGTISASAGTVTWGITASFSGTSQGYTFNLNMHFAGTMTVTATKITGNGVSEFSGTVSGNGQSVSFGLATAALVDLTYQSSPSFCITAGSVEVKRVWTQKPQGASGSTYADAAVKIVWTGCNVLTVAHSQ